MGRFSKQSFAGIFAILTYCLYAQQPVSPVVVSSHPQLDASRQRNAPALMNDFGQLSRYRAANAALHPTRAGEQRVVFFGDSITDAWNLEHSFPGKGYINRGISGQTTSQMLLRFRQDVIDLQPHVVIMLAGTNDIAGNTGPVSLEDVEKNYATLAELARVHHIVTIFTSVTPVNGDVPGKRELFETRPAADILALNKWLKNYCASSGDLYVDYFAAMVDPRGQMQRPLSNDGLHPNDAGYIVMAPLAESAIEKALQM
jgi:lysophospholipase L1-like esterase